MPKFSVIIPTYNRLEVLKRAVESVNNQTYEDYELIVVDDGSDDGTEAYLKELEIHHLRAGETPRGVSFARNLGVECSSGEWLAFLDSDDEWLPDKLERQLTFIEKNPLTRIVHGEERWIRNGVRVNPMKKHQKFGGDLFEASLNLCLISPSTVVLKRELFDEMQGFREDFIVCEDYDLWLKITSQEEVGFLKEELIVKYGGHEDQLSRRYRAMDYYRVKSIDWILDRGALETSKKSRAIEVLRKKSDILLSGYEKHNNLIHFDEIRKIQRKWL